MTASRARLPYDDTAAPEQMRLDAGRCGDRLGRAAARATGPAPSLRFEDQPREAPKAQVTIPQAAQRLAAALHLHLD